MSVIVCFSFYIADISIPSKNIKFSDPLQAKEEQMPEKGWQVSKDKKENKELPDLKERGVLRGSVPPSRNRGQIVTVTPIYSSDTPRPLK